MSACRWPFGDCRHALPSSRLFHTQRQTCWDHGEAGTGPGEFIYPVSVVEDDKGILYVAEYGGNDRVQRFSATGAYLGEFGGFGTEPGEFQRPGGMAWLDGKIYVADAINNRIQVFSDAGTYLQEIGGPSSSWSLLWFHPH